MESTVILEKTLTNLVYVLCEYVPNMFLFGGLVILFVAKSRSRYHLHKHPRHDLQTGKQVQRENHEEI